MIDTAGYPLAISYFKKEDWFKTVNGQQRRWQSHITQLESEVSKVLISNKVMVKIRCIHLVKGDIGISYEVCFLSCKNLLPVLIYCFKNRYITLQKFSKTNQLA